MNIGELIKKYRIDNNITMSAFAKKAGLSKGYISMLERNFNPRTKSGIVPTFSTLQSISFAMDIDVNVLLSVLSDKQLLRLNNETQQNNVSLSENEILLISNYRRLNDDGKEKVDVYVLDLANMPKYLK